ncbi:PD-(D/E)XK nuclease family protein [Leptobacterium flavescens]|uniref:PD-(D/E)XK nuclease family protein n=1 Tax=Leptobacterium flavescens TaxID=472055 RepID=A0A6P0UTZ8_9FLAO|nr:PD-(D/E)XK nuclease family protein [Leptobacterium flavescens]
MKSFIQEVAEEVLDTPVQLDECVFVLPSKRACTFLRNELLKKNKKTVFGPTLYSIEDFVQELSGVRLVQNTVLLFEFYQAYLEINPEEEKDEFYVFSKWATTALQDFNEIDRYLIPPDGIFSYLSSVKELNHWYLQEHKTTIQKNYIKFWNNLKDYYHSFRERLLQKQIGYQGLIYREAVENLEHYLQSNESKKHIFVGFNALNTAESTIIQEFLHSTDSEVYWDIDAAFLEDPEHDAGLFIRKYRNSWKYFEKHPFKNISGHFGEEKNIEIIGIPKNIGQAKYIGGLLQKLETNGSGLSNTAVVLGNEHLLPPVINSIPPGITSVNITSGFPLNLSPIASFFNILFEVNEARSSKGWYHKPFIDFLSHPSARILFKKGNNDYATFIIQKIQSENIAYIGPQFLEKYIPQELNPIISKCFFYAEETEAGQIIKNCLDLVLELREVYSSDQDKNPLYLEYLYRFYELFNQIDALNTAYSSIAHLKALKSIYKELLLKESVDFQGEPLEGLQLMGVLESRNLDFETVIISSVNEGILPSGKSDGSFIPFDIKHAFGLPTYKEKDAIYTYHFYRLLQRARNIYILYNTEPDVLEGSEKSRFLLQLSMNSHPLHSIKEIIASPVVPVQKRSVVQLTKTATVIEELKRIAEKGFSPTSLTNYIRNPLDFYHQSVLGIKDTAEVEETIAANTLGTVVHNTLEILYKPHEGKLLSTELIEEMESGAEELIAREFRKVYKSGDFSRGKNLIIFNIALKYVEKFLQQEKEDLRKGAEIRILFIESNLKKAIHIPELGFPVYLKGKVDRVDQRNGSVRIIDYKTGKVNQGDVEIVNWEDLTSDYKFSKAFQVLAYTCMFDEAAIKDRIVEAGIISFKNTQSGFLRFSKKDKAGAYAKKDSTIGEEIREQFLAELKKLILEIFDPGIPITEKEIA